MQAWLQLDDDGREYLVRTGTGVVTALAPVGIVGPDGRHAFYRVEIYCDPPQGRPGAIRFSAHPMVPHADPLFAAADDALREMYPILWSAQWHRHDWIPAELPIARLNLSTDARCVLSGLDRVDLPELAEAAIPDFIPVLWTEGAGPGS
jgi:hypothetical protein